MHRSVVLIGRTEFRKHRVEGAEKTWSEYWLEMGSFLDRDRQVS